MSKTGFFIQSGSISGTTTISARQGEGLQLNNKGLSMLRFCIVMMLQPTFSEQATLDLVHSLLGRFLRHLQIHVQHGIKLLKAGLVLE